MSQFPWLTERGSQRLSFVLCLVVPLLFGLIALTLGQDANWDLRNYHWYNPYSFLTGRWDVDILPAQTPTFYNPLLDVPFFLLAQNLPARLSGFVLGAVQGLNFIVLYFIARRLLAGALPFQRTAALVLAAVGVLGGGNLSIVGTTFNDNIVSLFVLGSVAVVVSVLPRGPTQAFSARAQWPWLVVAGMLVGAGAGLKLPVAVFAIGICTALLSLGAAVMERLARSIIFGLGVLGGFAAFAGQWMWHLWSTFHNPVFPYFNSVFKSPMGVAESYRDVRFIPESFPEALIFPFYSLINSYQTGEIYFRDMRITLAYVVLIATAIILVATREKTVPRSESSIAEQNVAAFLIAVGVLSYLTWLALFAIYRYIIPLEMLAPLIVVAAISLWPVGLGAKIKTSATLLALALITTLPGDWGRVPWGEQFVATKLPDYAETSNAIVLMYGTEPTSWLVPAFPATTAFIRVQGYGISPEDGDTGLNRRVRDRIQNHRGDFYALGAKTDRELAEKLFADYGLSLNAASCRDIDSNLSSVAEFCATNRKGNQS